jgi:hypothetical protein
MTRQLLHLLWRCLLACCLRDAAAVELPVRKAACGK